MQENVAMIMGKLMEYQSFKEQVKNFDEKILEAIKEEEEKKIEDRSIDKKAILSELRVKILAEAKKRIEPTLLGKKKESLHMI